MSEPAPHFTPELLDRLAARREVWITTIRPDGTTRRTIIWIVVVEGEVYVRSWKGERGYWYQAARENPDRVSLTIDGETVPVIAKPAQDERSIARCSEGLMRKYRNSRSLDSMLLPEILHTTLRLEPRADAAVD